MVFHAHAVTACLEYAVTVAVLDSKRIFSIYFFFRISDIFYIVGGKLNLWTTGASPIWKLGGFLPCRFFFWLPLIASFGNWV